MTTTTPRRQRRTTAQSALIIAVFTVVGVFAAKGIGANGWTYAVAAVLAAAVAALEALSLLPHSNNHTDDTTED